MYQGIYAAVVYYYQITLFSTFTIFTGGKPKGTILQLFKKGLYSAGVLNIMYYICV